MPVNFSMTADGWFSLPAMQWCNSGTRMMRVCRYALPNLSGGTSYPIICGGGGVACMHLVCVCVVVVRACACVCVRVCVCVAYVIFLLSSLVALFNALCTGDSLLMSTGCVGSLGERQFPP